MKPGQQPANHDVQICPDFGSALNWETIKGERERLNLKRNMLTTNKQTGTGWGRERARQEPYGLEIGLSDSGPKLCDTRQLSPFFYQGKVLDEYVGDK